MNLAPLLDTAYFVSGLLLVAGYGPQLRQAWHEPQATARAWSLPSLATWAACRLVALSYCAFGVGDTLLSLVVGLDVAGRLAMLVLLLRARRSTPDVRAARRPDPPSLPRSGWVLLLLAVMLAGCRGTPPLDGGLAAAGPAHSDRRETDWARRHALNFLLLPLIEADAPLVWRDLGDAYDCLGALSVTVDGQALRPGASLPARAFTLEWSGEQCTTGASAPLSGRARLQVFHDGEAYSAIVEAVALQLPGPLGPVRLPRRFTSDAALLAPVQRPGPG